MEFVDWHVEFVDCNLQTNEMGGKSKKGAFKEDLRNIIGNMKETEGTSQEHKRIKVQRNETQGTPNEDLVKTEGRTREHRKKLWEHFVKQPWKVT